MSGAFLATRVIDSEQPAMTLYSDNAGASPLVQPGRLSIDIVTRQSPGVMALKGELDVYTGPALPVCLAELIAEGRSRIVIDLAELKFIDSTGIGVLVGALKRARLSGGEIALRSPSAGVRKAFEVAGVSEIFAIA
jgi:anti-sigma B factor antagonist